MREFKFIVISIILFMIITMMTILCIELFKVKKTVYKVTEVIKGDKVFKIIDDFIKEE